MFERITDRTLVAAQVRIPAVVHHLVAASSDGGARRRADCRARAPGPPDVGRR